MQTLTESLVHSDEKSQNEKCRCQISDRYVLIETAGIVGQEPNFATANNKNCE